MNLDEDGDWVVPAACNGSLIIVHDGSYMAHIDKSICSAAVVLLCTTTMKMGTIHTCEKSDPYSASNYRGEILGGIIAGYILTIIDSLNPTLEGRVTCYCDNLGVINHANNWSKRLSEKQAQLDALLCFKNALAKIRFEWTYHHVKSHQDAQYSLDDLPIPQRLNV